MQYSIVKEVFGSPWQISAMGIQQYRPVVAGMLSGAVIDAEAEPKESLPYAVSAHTLQPVAWSVPEEPLEDDPVQDIQPPKEKVIHVLPMRGVLIKHDGVCGQPGARTLAQRLLDADKDVNVIGHTIIIEGPGGSAGAVPEITEAMQRCTKPVVAWIDGLMCSAHMYVGAFAAYRIASRATDLVGCIGTMISFSGRTNKSEEDLFKVREVTIYADDAFEKNEEYETAINSFDFKLAKEQILNPHNAQFVADMKSQLPGVQEKHLHGRTFQAGDVVGALVDEIGPFQQALNKVLELSDFTNNAQNHGIPGVGANEYLPITKEMKQFKNVNAALGVQSLEAVDEAVSLNEAQLEMLDVALQTNPDPELQAQLDAASATIGQRDATIAQISGQLETTSAAVVQKDETIAQLHAEIAVLKQAPADPGAQIVKPVDDGKASAGKAIAEGFENPFDALEEVSKEYLGKSIKNQ